MDYYILQDQNAFDDASSFATNITDFTLGTEANAWQTEDHAEALTAQAAAGSNFVILTRPKHP